MVPWRLSTSPPARTGFGRRTLLFETPEHGVGDCPRTGPEQEPQPGARPGLLDNFTQRYVQIQLDVEEGPLQSVMQGGAIGGIRQLREKSLAPGVEFRRRGGARRGSRRFCNRCG